MTAWFTQYKRHSTVKGSCGFEHVFMSEVDKEGDVSGLHSWIYYYYVEHNKKLKDQFKYTAFKDYIDLQHVSIHFVS